ncbi:hypothetical protein DPEC_G00036320 [Dallia pectoralis]|uniref:Uncharacterized protein n=1 Tax=Dallia pectoralis TaxID=75939 RepID=A0ACC2HDM5_DALPE|nr:hypothetical protein DPEC_G00036320 [Dallia pectoralis]
MSSQDLLSDSRWLGLFSDSTLFSMASEHDRRFRRESRLRLMDWYFSMFSSGKTTTLTRHTRPEQHTVASAAMTRLIINANVCMCVCVCVCVCVPWLTLWLCCLEVISLWNLCWAEQRVRRY